MTIDSAHKAGFSLLAPLQTGVTFSNFVADLRSITNRNLLSGSGVAAGDVDGDGWCDLYFCGLDSENVLYRNRGGCKFEDVTPAALACRGDDSTAAAFADVDGDGDLDLLVNSLGGGTRLFANDGKAGFKERTSEAGLASKFGSMSMALADIEGDGDLDLYVANFRPTTLKDEPRLRFRVNYVDGKPVVLSVNDRSAAEPDLTNRFEVSQSGVVMETGEPDGLYLNDGKGYFKRASFTDGRFTDENGKALRAPDRDWGLAVQFYDFTGDGAPDIYVCNDLHSPDRIWVNDGSGRFRALDSFSLRCTSTFSMGSDFADIDRDGDTDFFVVDMLSRDHQKRHVQVSETTPMFWPIGLNAHRPQLSRNTLQLNRGDNTFAEVAFYSGVEASEWSWGPIFLDVDLDGLEDILITNGQLRDFQNADMARRIEASRGGRDITKEDIVKMVSMYPNYASANVAFRNLGNLKFQEVGKEWGFDTVGISQGMALADLDNDGDCDVVMNNLNGVAGVYRNECGAPRLGVRLKGMSPNTRGVGAKIRVRSQSQEMIAAGRYLSSDDAIRVFAAGNLTNDMTIEVVWRSGKKTVVKGAKANRIYDIEETAFGVPPSGGRAGKPPEGGTPNGSALFEDVSHLLDHTHHEEPFEDFDRQPLLPRKLSQLGPGVGWYDVDGDGWDDLVIAGGRGGRLAVYHNNGKGGFTALTNASLNRLAGRDQTTALGMGAMLLVGSSNYEDGKTNGGWVRVYDLKRDVAGDSILGPSASTGPLALADVNGDGHLDLFVGGRAVAGRYPEPADSLLMRNEGGKLVVHQRLEKLGLVSGAVWSDLDADGQVELVLACEWGAVRVFGLDGGKLVERTVGLQEHTGWWNGVATGDFDGDGRLDIVASNWGLNSPYRASREHPAKLYFGDFDGNDTIDLVQTYFNASLRKDVPERGLRLMSMAMPIVQTRMETFEAYGAAGVTEILGDNIKAAQTLHVTTLASTVFLNRGGRFKAVALPVEAQLAPAFGIAVADLDGDGHEDIFLAQNFFPVTPENSRLDGGRGLLLRGDGRGGFTAVPGQESGIKIYGEQRGCAASDYDGDGRVDLAVTQNGAGTKLLRNTKARAGLRVRLHDRGIGSTLRLKFGDRLGPARELHAGAGYWSQDSAVQVLSTPEAPTHIEVRWAGGKVTTSEVPKGAKEIMVEPNGAARQTR